MFVIGFRVLSMKNYRMIVMDESITFCPARLDLRLDSQLLVLNSSHETVNLLLNGIVLMIRGC